MKKLLPDAKRVKFIGRTFMTGGVLWSAFSGTGIEFIFEGKKLFVTLMADGIVGSDIESPDYARYAVYVDNRRVLDGMLDEKTKTLEIFNLPSAVKAKVKILKISECAMSTMGISLIETNSKATLTPTPAKARRIEFIGDSITCGYGVDDENELHSFKTSTEDCTGAYAYKTAAALKADHSLVSVSGYGIISGYTGTGEEKIPEQTVPQYYKKLGFSYQKFGDTTAPQDIMWDFSRFVPDAIVINLGTNDDSYCLDHEDRQREYSDEYKKFLSVVRGENPYAHIFCTVGIMGERIFKALKTAVDEYKKETGDKNITTFCFTEQDSKNDGYAADYHPTRKTHDKAALALTDLVREAMGWKD